MKAAKIFTAVLIAAAILAGGCVVQPAPAPNQRTVQPQAGYGFCLSANLGQLYPKHRALFPAPGLESSS
jgi:hypothetical protein